MLNSEYFNSLRFVRIRRKYYDAVYVDTAILDIRIRADEMNRELARLQSELREKNAELEQLKKRTEESEKILSAARENAGRITDEAKEKAGKILADAERKSDEIKKKASENQSFALTAVENFYSRIRSGYEEQLENLNGMWQEFLCSLDNESTRTPEDLAGKISMIASEIREIDESI